MGSGRRIKVHEILFRIQPECTVSRGNGTFFFSLDFIKLVFASLSYSNFSEYLQQYSCDVVCVLLPTLIP